MAPTEPSGKRLIVWVDRLLDRIFAVAGAFFFSQFPTFLQQYLHRLAGHIDELRWVLHKLERVAEESGQSLHHYIAHFLGSRDPLIVSQGRLMSDLVSRQTLLEMGHQKITAASVYTKPWQFLSHMDTKIAQATVSEFHPGFVFSGEGIVYATMGLLAGYLVYHLVNLAIRGMIGLGEKILFRARRTPVE